MKIEHYCMASLFDLSASIFCSLEFCVRLLKNYSICRYGGNCDESNSAVLEELTALTSHLVLVTAKERTLTLDID